MKYVLTLTAGVILGVVCTSFTPLPTRVSPAHPVPLPYRGSTVRHPDPRAVVVTLASQPDPVPDRWYAIAEHTYIRYVLNGPDAPFVQFWEGDPDPR